MTPSTTIRRLLFSLIVLAVVLACRAPAPSVTPTAPAAKASPTPSWSTSQVTVQPRATTPSHGSSQENAGQKESHLDPATRQAIFQTLWEAVDQHYVDPNFNGVNWKKVKKTYEAKVKQASSDEAFHELMREMVGELGDRHSAYYTPQEAWAAFKLSRGHKGQAGLGISLLPLPEEQAALVQWAIPGNAAANAGIRSGDLILAVDGQPLCCDAHGNLFESLLLDQAGSQATLTVQTDGQAPRQVVVTRQPLLLQQVVEGDRLPEGIAYVSIHTFLKSHLVDDFDPVWREASAGASHGAILDLRTNGGGFKFEAVDILGYFLPEGEYGYFQSREYDAPLLIHDRSRDVNGSQHMPLAILVDEGTSSIAEVFALALQEAGRARVFGRPSNGNVEITRRYDLPAGAAALIAVERYISARGENIEGRGVTPDVLIDQRWRDVLSPQEDQALQAAREWLKSH